MTKDIPSMTDAECVVANERLVHDTVWKHFGKSLASIKAKTGFEYEDLVQYGMIGLIKAKRRFDPSFGCKFSTFAVPTISGEIKRWVRDTNKTRVPRSIIDVAYKIYTQGLSENSPEDIAKILDLPIQLVKEAMAFDTATLSLNATILDNGDSSATFEELLVATGDFEEDTAHSDLVGSFLATLSDRELRVWTLHSNLGLNQATIGIEVGISQVQVSRIIRKIFVKAEHFGRNYVS